MSVVAVIGAQWGDEGKGKVVDLYASYADLVVRYSGGANAGHTLVVGGEKTVLHLVPSGALHPGARCLIGQGCVVDPRVLTKELDLLRERELLATPRVQVSDRAFLVLPHHVSIDGAKDAGRGIGTTKRGIGPAYQDKVARSGLRIGDLIRPATFRERLAANLDAWKPVAKGLGVDLPSAQAIEDEYLPLGEALAPYVSDTGLALHKAWKAGERILLEGAQGTMLDVDHGTYPFVTSSTVTAGGACTGAGLGPRALDRVIGITKAYTTRVGSGPFPTELGGAEADQLRAAGAEFGATTGRPRRCGWLDVPVLRHAARVNGLTELVVTKLDVLSGMDPIPICVAYDLAGERHEEMPYEGLDRVSPVLEHVEGWKEDLTGVRQFSELPAATRRYLERIEELTECPVGLVSVGPGREQTLRVTDPFSRTEERA